ncbi:LLM class flavin-dependent oxidoreductase [Streptosporangium lutulentum]
MSDQHQGGVTFGIKTTPMRVSYEEILRVWQEADALPQITDAWLWGHLMPIAGPRDGQILEGWTLLSALAAQTRRLRLGLLVTSNRIRQPAVLGKIATTVDVISRGRLVMGLGVGGTRQPPNAGGVAGENPAVAEYDAYGLTLVPPAEGIARLAETIAILKSMWTRDVFDFHGRHYTLKGNRNEPKPVQRPGPPLLVGGWGTRTLRLVAEQADIWNIPGPRTTPSTTSSSAAASWTHTARPSAGTRGRSPAPCSTSSPTTTPPVTARRSWISSPLA